MVEDHIIEKVRAIGVKMRETVQASDSGGNRTTVTDEIKRLAEEAIAVSSYHDHIFVLGNAIRSGASTFGGPPELRKKASEILGPISELETWNPNHSGDKAAVS